MIVLSGGGETDLVALATVKAELGIEDSQSDAVLERHIDVATARIGRYCARTHFASATAVETLRLVRVQSGALWLRHWPVASIASVVEDGVALAAGDYELEDGRQLWRLDGADNRSCWPAAKIVVTYAGGYTLPSGCPADLAQQCIDLVKLLWNARDRDPAVKGESADGIGSVEYWVGATGSDALPPEIARGLFNYRNFAFG